MHELYGVVAMARHFQVSRQTINNWLKRYVTTDTPLPPVPCVTRSKSPPHDENLRFQLIADPDAAVLYVRRRGDCARLRDCEWEYVRLYGARQGRCPPGCPGIVLGDEPDSGDS